MPLSLNAQLKARLVQQLSAVLKGATVYCNILVSTTSLAGLREIKSLPDKGELADELKQYIGESPFSTFVYGEVNSILRGIAFDKEVVDKPLVSYEGYADVTPIAQELVDSFCSLPWTYQVAIRLPEPFISVVAGDSRRLELSPRHRIVAGSLLKETYPLKGPGSNSLANIFGGLALSSGWKDDSAYLQVDVEGYYGFWVTEPFMVAREHIFSFFGLGLALGLFVDAHYEVLGSESASTPFYVHRLQDGEWLEHRTVPLEDIQQKGINSLFVAQQSMDDPDVMLEKLQRIATVFSSSAGKNILLSSRWLFDSQCGRDELLSYVQAAVAIEILLGDEDADHSVGLTSLMANRCAYLIAKTPSARARLLKDFRDIYKVRSKIVHRGKSRLNEEEVRLFYSLQGIIRAVIDKEQRLLARAVEIGVD